MRAIVQRVSHAKVAIEGRTVAKIGSGLLALVGAHKDDTDQNAKKLADRVAGLRIFNDPDGKMNLSLPQTAAVLAVSNFTVYGDPSQRRPSFTAAAPFDQGKELFDAFVQALKDLGVTTETGVFGADMQVELTNDGPVTLVVDC